MKKRLAMLSCISILVINLSGCNGLNWVVDKVYTQEDMTRFYSDKVVIDEINNIDVESNYADFEIIASDNYYIEYSYYYINNEPKLSIEDGTLTFSDRSMNTGSYSIRQTEDNYLKIYVPTTCDFESITIDKSSGECSIGGFLTDELIVSNSYGDNIISNCVATLTNIDISSGKLTIENSDLGEAQIENEYGDVKLNKLNSEEQWMDSLSIHMSSGNLDLSNLYCKELELENNYGENELTSLSIGKLNGDFDSGNVVFTDTLADEIEIENAYGNIGMELFGEVDDYKYDIESEYGSIKIGDSTYENNVSIDHGGEKEISLKVSSGNIKITFNEQ